MARLRTHLAALAFGTSPAQVGPVILGWINEQLEVDSSFTFSAGGWGDEQGSLVDVSDRL